MSLGFLDHMRVVPDHRIPGMVIYPLDELLFATLVGVVCGADDWEGVEEVATGALDWLRGFLPFANGIPTAQTLRKVFRLLDSEALQRGFAAWAASLRVEAREVIAVDGKTLRRSKGAKAAVHMVSAFAARQRLALGQVKVADKANEIVAIPKLLAMLVIEGAIVTIDAMGCQRDIAQQIVDQKADYVLALKGNQGTLREDVELFANEQKANNFKDTTVSRDKTVDGDHARIETRTVTVVHDVAWLQERHEWPGLKGVVMVESAREMRDKVERETRFYITSLTLPASQMGSIVRDHWAVENGLHWVMDMVFRDDECRVRTDHAPANFTTIKHIALNLIRRTKSKDSLRLRRKVAAWDDEFLASLIAA